MNIKSISASIFLLPLLSQPVFSQQLQPSNEVQVQNQGEADMIDLIDGCKPKVKPSCQARIVCTASETILGDNPRAVQVAMRIAQKKSEW